jgi:hypothetical protein
MININVWTAESLLLKRIQLEAADSQKAETGGCAPACIHIVVQPECEKVSQAELFIHDKVLARSLHEHLPVTVAHRWVVQVLYE